MRSTRIFFVSTIAALGAIVTQSPAIAGGSAALSGGGGTVTAAAAALSSVAVSPANVVGGTPVTGTVTLNTAAPSGGTFVALSSDDTVAATTPASVTVPAGSRTATFPVTTKAVPNPQSALIIGTAGGVTTYAIVTVYPQSAFSTGSIAIIPGGNGTGTVTSLPGGINCHIGSPTTGACSAFYAVGALVRLTAQAGAGSKFDGFRGTPGCFDPSKITVARATTIYCQPSFSLK